MSFQQVVDGIGAMTCVVSVEKRPNGGYGDIRIVTGNRAYIDSIEHPMGDVQMLTTKFTPNSLYTDYLSRDLNFEEYCYQAAVEKKCLHSYAHPDRYDVWFNMTFLPLVPDDGDVCYCTYTMEINLVADSSRLSNVSTETASAVLETAIKLRGAMDFEAAMADSRRGSEAMRDTLILQFFILINRIAAADAPAAPERRIDPKVRDTLSYISENLTGELSVDTLADRVFLSRYHFMRLFKDQTGETVHAYVRQKRLLYAARLIREGMPIGQAASVCGFNDYSVFNRAFRASFGIRPADLRK